MAGLDFIDREKFFAELEPRLTKIAYKYRAHDAAGEARSWFAEFVEIFDKIQSTPSHLVFQDLTNGGTISDQDRIRRNVVWYLMASFRNALSKRDGYARHKNPLPAIELLLPFGSTPGTSPANALAEMIDSSKLYLSDLIALAKSDVAKATKLTAVRGRVNFWFMSSVVAHFTALQEKLGDFPIVKDSDAVSTREFFVREIVEGRFSGIRSHIETAYEIEKDPKVREAMNKLLDTVGGPSHEHPGKAFHATSGAAALRQKITFYFNEHHGGLRKRLMQRLTMKGIK